MSCNGCRVLRKGCSDACILRPCLQWIESPESQGHATVFVAKFFGRAGLMGFINAVPENQRPALFQSLLYEACGRTVNPVFGAVGLLSSGNWNVCQAAVETVLRGGSLKPAPSSSSSSCKSMLVAKSQQQQQQQPATSSETQRSTKAVLSAFVQPQPLSSALAQPLPKRLLCEPLAPPPLPLSSPEKERSVLPSSSSPPIKRSKQSDQCVDVKASNADPQADHIHGLILNPVMLSSNSVAVAAAPTVQHDEEGTCKLVAPVPRRVRPHMQVAMMAVDNESAVPRSLRVHHDHFQENSSSNTIELDLTLNSHANLAELSPSDGIVVAKKVPFMRVGSPSSHSEGSVTSFDTVELPCCPVRTPSPQQERQLLHLLV